jgi:hypothetical protein
MELLPEDKKVLDLLTKLKSSNGGYPSEMLSTRRNQYIRQVANVGLGLGLGAGLKHTLRGGGSSAGTTATITSKVLEVALIAAIAIEGGTVAYIYRDKILEAVRSLTGSPAVQVTSPLDESAEEVVNPVVNAPSETPLTATAIGTPSGTPVPGATNNINAGNPGSSGSNNGTGVGATAVPSDNNGNQYGLTPKPERTKESNGKTNTQQTDTGGNGGNKDK